MEVEDDTHHEMGIKQTLKKWSNNMINLEMISSNLTSHQQDGLELFIDSFSGDIYCIEDTIARLEGISETSLKEWSNNMDLKCYKKDELELYIDSYNEEVYCLPDTVARICEVSEKAIREWMDANNITSEIFDVNTILDAIAEHNTLVLLRCTDRGVTRYLYSLVDYTPKR